MCISCVEEDRTEKMSGMEDSFGIIFLVSLIDTRMCNVSCATME